MGSNPGLETHLKGNFSRHFRARKHVQLHVMLSLCSHIKTN